MSFALFTSDTSNSGASTVYYVDKNGNINITTSPRVNQAEVPDSEKPGTYNVAPDFLQVDGKNVKSTAQSLVALGFTYNNVNYARIFFVDPSTSILTELMKDGSSANWSYGGLGAGGKDRQEIKVAPGSPLTAHVVNTGSFNPQIKVYFFPAGTTPRGDDGLSMACVNVPGKDGNSWFVNKIR